MSKSLADTLLNEVTIGNLLDLAAERFPQREALVHKNERVSFSELRQRANVVSKSFLRAGIQKRDKVAVWLSNCPEFIYTYMALEKIGAVLVPLNTRFKTVEFEDITRRADCVALVTTDHFLKTDFMKMIRQAMPELKGSKPGALQAKNFPMLKNVIVVSEEKYPGTLDFSTFMASGESYPDSELQKAQSVVVPEDIAFLLFTAGTTGLPKGVLLTHHATSHHFLIGERQGVTESDRSILFLPLCHIYGLATCFLNRLSHGACVVLQEYFDPEESLKLMVEEKITFMDCVPSNAIMMLNHENFPKYQGGLKVRRGLVGGATVPYTLLVDIVEKMGARGMFQVYGQTECCGTTSINVNGDHLENVAASIGKVMDDFEAKVVAPSTGKVLPYGKDGELLIRGRACMRGYYKMPKETAATIDKDGWIHTGDLVRMDEDNYLYFVGRLKDIIMIGGEPLAPAEVEHFLFTHPKIKDAQVVGVPDPRLEEVPAAFIQLKEREKSSPEEIMDFCKGKIANYKIPRYVKFVDEFSLTATGKIQKFKLREQAINEWSLTPQE